MPNTEKWRWLWRLNIPQRCKIFLYLALNDRLPSNSVSKAAHYMTDSVSSSSCPFCHGQETLLHLLRDCPRAKSAWSSLVAPRHQHGFFSRSSMWDWMVTYLQQPWSCVDGDCSNDCALFAATVWLLWKDRKGLVCDNGGGSTVSSERLIQRLGALADVYGRIVEVECCAAERDPDHAVRCVSWSFYWNQSPSQGQVNLVAENSQVVLPKL